MAERFRLQADHEHVSSEWGRPAGQEQSKPEGSGTDAAGTSRKRLVHVMSVWQKQHWARSGRPASHPGFCHHLAVATSKSLSASGGPHLQRLGGKLYGHQDSSSLTSGPALPRRV